MRVFDESGPRNTDECLELASRAMKELGIGEAVIATKSGDTALKAIGMFPGMKIVAVSCHAGFKEPFKVGISPEVRAKLESGGVRIVTAGHAVNYQPLKGLAFSPGWKFTHKVAYLNIEARWLRFSMNIYSRHATGYHVSVHADSSQP
jgi:hypothetical protein